MNGKIFITNKTKGTIPRLSYLRLKNHILGERYNLSIVFIGNTTSRALNKRFRKKDHPANILSFPLGKLEGEIFINPRVAKKEASGFKMSYSRFMLHLLIHGMLHLKGMRHGSKMEQIEQKLGRKF